MKIDWIQEVYVAMSFTHPNCFGLCIVLNNIRIGHEINRIFMTLSKRTGREEI